MIPRVARRVEENTILFKSHDSSLRIDNPGKLGADARMGKTIDGRLAEQAGWVPSSMMDPRLLLAAHGGYAQAMAMHINNIPEHDSYLDNVAVIKSALDAYTRPSDFTWVVLTNGSIALVGEFDARDAAALRVCVDCHKMLDPSTTSKDVELPSLRVGGFVVRKQRPSDRTISFSQDMQLMGLTTDSTDAARMVAQDAAISFLRPSRNRSRVLSVSVQALDDVDDPTGPVVSSRLFDIEYRWRDLDKELARFDGSATELNGEMDERTEAVADGVRQRQVVAAIVSHAATTSPHSIDTLCSRLQHYDSRLVANPLLVTNRRFLMMIGVVCSTLMPMMKAELSRAPEKSVDEGFVSSYNLCARFLSEPGLEVA